MIHSNKRNDVSHASAYYPLTFSQNTLLPLKMSMNIKQINLPKYRMRTNDVYHVLQEAMRTNKKVVIQIEAVDRNGFYQEDVIGSIKKSDSLGIYINNQKVHYDEIRNIRFYRQKLLLFTV